MLEYPNHHLMRKNRLIKLAQQPLCEECHKKATQIHHKDLSKDNHDLDNLMSVCCQCHADIHGYERKKVGIRKMMLKIPQEELDYLGSFNF